MRKKNKKKQSPLLAILTGLVMSLEFVRKKRFKLKRPIYVRNVDSSFNKKRPIKYIVEVNIYY